MDYKTIIDAIRGMSDSDFTRLSDEMPVMRQERAAAPLVEEAKREVQAETIAEVAEKIAEKDTKLTPPAKPDGKTRPWAAWHPLNPATHFYFGDLATHKGETWRNVVDPSRKQPNVWEPRSPGIDERYWVKEKKAEPATPTPAPAVAPYEVGKAYNVGDVLTYGGATYRVLQAHTSAAHWQPSTVPALYANN